MAGVAVHRWPVALVAALVLLPVLSPLQPQSAAAGPAARITASTTAEGSDAAALATRALQQRPRWLSGGRPVGTTLTTTFVRLTSIDGMRIEGAGAGLRIRDTYLQFSDGSTLFARTAQDGSRTIRFPRRAVRWVRMTVVSVRDGQAQVGLAGWWMHHGSGVRAARPRGDSARDAAITASSGRATRSGWAAERGGRQWIQLRWKRPVELTTVRIGAAGDDGRTVLRGFLQFSDGSRVLVGALEAAGGAPTTVAFTPRTTRALRFVVTEVAGGTPAAVGRLGAWAVGSLPPHPATTAHTYSARAPASKSCARTDGAPTRVLVLLCPSNGSSVGRTARIVVSGPRGAALRVEAELPRLAEPLRTVTTGAIGADGTATLTVPMQRLSHGATAVRVSASGVEQSLHVQLENRSGVRERPASSPAARGMQLVYDEGFDEPLSATRTGASARYASGKPNSYGIDDFGDAIFAQPTGSGQNLGAFGGLLRIRTRALEAGEADPAGFDRRYLGGLISSAHLGGSGFTAQYGYFEARVLGPAGEGTWPAFWLLSSGSLTRRADGTGEIDAVETHGHDTRGACGSLHNWTVTRPFHRTWCEPVGQDHALGWHTYGARVTPSSTIFTVDGEVVRTARRAANADQPFFFLLDLALGGGWPVDLAPTSGAATLYVDSVRVWV